MPTTRRRRIRPFHGSLRPTVLHFLQTGKVAVQPGDSGWLALCLGIRGAEEAPRLWQAGDQAGALAVLESLPCGHKLRLG